MSRLRRRTVLIGLFLLLAMSLPAWLIYGQVRAWRELRAAKEVLEQDPRAARDRLAFCMKIWPSNGEVRFLAARAARRSGDWADAMRLLDEAAEREWPEEAIDLERALLRAQAGEFDAVKGYLAACLKNEHPDELMILEVVVPLFIKNYDLGYAGIFLARWRELRPKSAQAWRYQGMLEELRDNTRATAEAYTEALRLDPSNREDRLALARALVRLNKPAEALPLLEELNKGDTVAPDTRLLLARCYHALDRRDEARRLLAWVLETSPNSAEALQLRGRLELDVGQPERAIRFLERALELEPGDRELLYTYIRCLRRLDRTAEIPALEKRLKHLEAELARLAELVRQIAARPYDPDPRREAGEIMLKNRQETEGLRWLHSALKCKPDHAATHAVLADHFERKGDAKRAGRHRAIANRPGGQKEPKPGEEKK